MTASSGMPAPGMATMLKDAKFPWPSGARPASLAARPGDAAWALSGGARSGAVVGVLRIDHRADVYRPDRGRPVARLVPITADAWADMIASGRVTPAEDGTDVADEAPGKYDVDASAVLAEMRADER